MVGMNIQRASRGSSAVGQVEGSRANSQLTPTSSAKNPKAVIGIELAMMMTNSRTLKMQMAQNNGIH
jgi:hypothetical protein